MLKSPIVITVFDIYVDISLFMCMYIYTAYVCFCMHRIIEEVYIHHLVSVLYLVYIHTE